MKSKSIFTIFLAFLIFVVFCCTACATTEDPEKWRNETSHNRWTQSMIFGNPMFSTYKSEDVKKKIEILQDAVLLCIDQYNSSYVDKLSTLRENGVPGLPSSIDAINFTAGTDHRVYTHRGWNHGYADSELQKGHADVRRNILRSAVEHVFRYDEYCASSEQADKMREAMCVLLYDTHILGDRFHSKIYYGAASTLLLADDNSQTETVINDLCEYLPDLFPNQKNAVKEIDRQLKQYSGEIVRAHREHPDKEDLRKIDSDYAEKIKDLLRDQLPGLLKQQEWFTAAFSLSCWDGI